MRNLISGNGSSRFVAGTAAFSLLLCSFAEAQVTQEAAQGSSALQEVVVTAQKRREDLQKVPQAVTAISAADIDRRGITSLQDLDALVPGLTVADNGLFQKIPTIRGVGNETERNAATAAGVALHINGVYLGASSAGMMDYVDVDHIEVLRGPQGTVFGQSAVGGVINVITHQPQIGDFSGYADVQGGNYDLINTRAATNLPISDTTAARIAVQYLSHSGWATNLDLPNVPYNNANDFTARGQFLWQPSDAFSATFRIQTFNTSTGDEEQKNIADPTPDPRQFRQNLPGEYYDNTQIYSAELQWHELSWATLKSISSYQSDRMIDIRDADRSDGFWLPRDDGPYQNLWTHTWTQEFNLTSTNNTRLPWIVGFFYYNFKYFVDSAEFTGPDHDLLLSNLDRGFISDAEDLRGTFSFFSEGTFHATDKFRITAGFRTTEDHFKFLALGFPFTAQPRVVRTTEDDVTGRVNLQYDILPQSMLYGGWSSGIKPGTANLTFGGFVPGVVGETHVNALEAGLKNRLLGNRLQLNAAAYYYDYKNFQFYTEAVAPGHAGAATLPHARAYGFELESSALLTDALRLDLNYSLSESRIGSNQPVLDTGAVEPPQQLLLQQGFALTSPQVLALRQSYVQTVYGNSLPKSPKNMVNFDLNYTMDIASYGRLTSTVLYQYKGDFFYTVFNNPSDRVAGYSTVNLNFQYVPRNDRWSFEFAVTNLTDKVAIESLNSDIFGSGATSAIFIPPRQYLGRVAYRF